MPDPQGELLRAGVVEGGHPGVGNVGQVVESVQLGDGERVADPGDLEREKQNKKGVNDEIAGLTLMSSSLTP